MIEQERSASKFCIRIRCGTALYKGNLENEYNLGNTQI